MLTSHVLRRGFGAAAPLAWHLEKARPAADWTESGGANIRPGPGTEQAIEGILGQRTWQSLAFYPVAGKGETASVDAITVTTADGSEYTAATNYTFTAGGDTLVVELPAPASIKRVLFKLGAARGPLKLLIYSLQYVKPRTPDPVAVPMSTGPLPTSEPAVVVERAPWWRLHWAWIAGGVAVGGAVLYLRRR